METASEDAQRERGEWAGGTQTPDGQLRVHDRLACAVLAAQLGPPHLRQPGAGLDPQPSPLLCEVGMW